MMRAPSHHQGLVPAAALGAVAFAAFTQAALPVSAAGHVAARMTAPRSATVELRQRAALAAGTMPLVYVGESDGVVRAYAVNGVTQSPPTPPVETISNLHGPSGLAVDPAGNLYVVELETNDIKVFAPGSVTPLRTLAGGAGQHIQTIAVAGNGTIYAGTASNVVDVYRNGATTPSKTLSSPLIGDIISIAADGIGNVFITYGTPDHARIGVGTFPAVTSLGAGVFAPLPALIGALIPNQIAVDPVGDVLVGDMIPGNASGTGGINVYRPATETAAFKYGYLDRVGNELFALGGPTGGTVFVAPVNGGFIDVRDFPSAAAPQDIFLPTSAQVFSIAAYPAAPLGTW